LSTVDSIRNSLMISTLSSVGEGSTTHISYNTGPRISGRLIINDNHVGGTTKELMIQAQIYDADGTGASIDYASGTGGLNTYLWKSRLASALTGVAAKPFLQIADSTRFDGLIDIDRYSRIRNCQINAGLTVLSTSVDLRPSGMINCYFAGTFTGPVNSARMNGMTNYWFKANGATLAGGATKVIEDDLTP
jgi:hypothetical protein